MADSYFLQRFVDAQAHSYDTALGEVRRGAKHSHWMWFIFPQIAGLGSSPMAQRYAIASLDEARAYLNHPILGARLHEIIAALQGVDPPDAETVFGPIDAVKLRSSLTLFGRAADDGDTVFRDALARWFDGAEDPATIERL